MKEYKALIRFSIDGISYNKGEAVLLQESKAVSLLKRKVISEGKGEAPKKEDVKGEKISTSKK